MYKNVDTYVGNNDINSAMAECLRGDFPHLGVLLGRISKQSDGMYHTLLGQLYDLINKSIQEGVIITEQKSEIKEEPAEVKEILQEISAPTYTKVKLLCNWMTSEDLAKLWNKMSQGDFTWNTIKIVWNEEPDYYVIINCPPINEFVPSNKTILFQMEPRMAENPDFWGDYADPNEKYFVKVYKHKNEYNNIEWHLSKTYNDLKTMTITKNPEYNDVISTVLSAKYKDPGHIKRVDFVKFLEQKGIQVCVFGDNRWEYKDYKGSLPYHCKDNGIFPYKYHFNVENHSDKNYFTEKIVDAILGECLCFYSGCFNLKEYLPEEALVYLELSNFEKDYKIIETAIREDWWIKRLPAIREAKLKILNELQFFPRLEKVIKEHESRNGK